MDELTFLDLAILRKVDSESTVEKFGSLINTSFFETANLLGTIKIKGYIGIEPSVGGVSKITMTDAGSSILAVADQRAKEPLGPLDNAILQAVAGGARELSQLQSALNVRSADLAFHINKLVAQGLMDYEIRSAKVFFLLSETGFNATGGVRVQQTLSAQQPEAKEASGEELSSKIAREGEGLPAKPQQASEGQPPMQAAPAAPQPSAPPWVKPSDLGQKAGAAPTIGTEQAQKPPHAHRHEPEKKAAEAKKPLTEEEQKRLERRRRLVSKLEYYLMEYAPYLILVLIVLLIFAGAIALSLSKVS